MLSEVCYSMTRPWPHSELMSLKAEASLNPFSILQVPWVG